MTAVLGVLLLVWLAGLVLRTLLLGWPRSAGAACLAIGEGYLLGVLLAGNLLWLAGDGSIDRLFGTGVATMIGFVTLGSIAIWLLRERASWQWPAPATTTSDRRWVIVVAAWLLLVGIAIFIQAVALPTLTWDAWNAWLAKSKSWFHAGQFVQAMDLSGWLPPGSPDGIAVVAAGYPEALPRVATMLAYAGGRWHDGFAHAAWPLLWIALGLQVAGALRTHGCSWRVAAGSAGALLTLPLLTAHASLAGYADLWLAAVVLAGAQHAAAFAHDRQPRSLIGALLFAVLLPTVKLEGAVWMLVLAASLAAWSVPYRLRLWLAGGAVLAFGGWMIVQRQISLPLPGLGPVAFEWGAITVPVVGRLELFWRQVGGTVAESLFLLPNWSLLWYMAPLIIAWRWRAIVTTARGGLLGVVLAGGTTFLFVLFFFTDASAWAENLTSLNRLVMHLVPLLVFWLALLLAPVIDRPAPHGRWIRFAPRPAGS